MFINFKILIANIIFLSLVSSVFAENLVVSLSPESTTVDSGSTVRVKLNVNVPIRSAAPIDIGVDGGVVDSVRKLSNLNYVILARPAEGASKLELQVPADTLYDKEGNMNTDASNLVSIDINDISSEKEIEKNVNISGKSDNDKVISGLLESLKNTTSKLQNQANTPQYYNCRGKAIPITQKCKKKTNLQTTIVTTPDVYYPVSSPLDVYVADPYMDSYSSPYSSPYSSGIYLSPYNSNPYSGYGGALQQYYPTYAEPVYTYPSPRRSIFTDLLGWY